MSNLRFHNPKEIDPGRVRVTIHTTDDLSERAIRYRVPLRPDAVPALILHELSFDKSFHEVRSGDAFIEDLDGSVLAETVVKVGSSNDWEAPAVTGNAKYRMTKQEMLLAAARSTLYFANDRVPPYNLLPPQNKS